jgi:competence protein ComEA
MNKNIVIAALTALSLLASAPAMAKSEHSHHKRAEASQTQGQEQSSKVDINTATASELAGLKGIGVKRAADILAYREANGPFKSIEGLSKVKGVSEKIVDKNKGMLSLTE